MGSGTSAVLIIVWLIAKVPKNEKGKLSIKKPSGGTWVFLRKLNWDNIETSSTLLYDRLVA